MDRGRRQGVNAPARSSNQTTGERMTDAQNRIRIGNAPCSWGTLEFGSVTGDRIRYGEMLDQLAAAGYTGTELGDWGFLPTEAERLAEALAARRLDLTGAYVGAPLEDKGRWADNMAVNLRTARQLAHVAARNRQDIAPFLVMALDNGTVPARIRNAGRITADLALDADQWRDLAWACNQIARIVNDETGIPVVFHHHAAGYVETPAELDRLADATDDGLGLVFDTGHYALGAGRADTVLDAMQRLASRIAYVHFKDWSAAVARTVKARQLDYFAAVGEGIFCELGQGDVDFPAVRAWLLDQGYRGYVTVEQDVIPGLGTPYESARRSRAYLASIGFH